MRRAILAVVTVFLFVMSAGAASQIRRSTSGKNP